MTELLTSIGIWAVVLTLGVYQLGLWIQKKTGLVVCNNMLISLALCNPILIAAGVMILLLLGLDIPNEAYQQGMQAMSWLLTPATVCLAIPLYTQLSALKGNLKAIFLGIGAGTAVGIGVILGMCALFRLDGTLAITLLPKSVTSAMAIAPAIPPSWGVKTTCAP